MDNIIYVDSMLSILNDKDKFKILNKDPTYFRESQLQRRLLNLKKKGFFGLEVYDKVYPRGSKPVRVYGLPKTHKTFEITLPLRPIVASMGTFNYNLA